MSTRIKKTNICSDIQDYILDIKKTSSHIPKAGDVAIFEVLFIGKHTTLQSDSKRNVKIMPGDQIMAAFGNRYATDQFEGYVPDTCLTEFHMLAAGGIVGLVKTMHDRFSPLGPTRVKIIGYVTHKNGQVINTKELKASHLSEFSGVTPMLSNVVLSVGSSMNSGKTTTAAHIVHGLKKNGHKVAFMKLTGTTYTKDKDLAYDLGADISVDFSDFGFPSTYMCDEKELLNLYESLIRLVSKENPEYIVIEIADGLYQRETKMLLTNKRFLNTIDKIIFSASDSLSAVNGVQIMATWNIVPVALSGVFTMSPLLMQEVKENVSVPSVTLADLIANAPEILKQGTRLRMMV